MRQLVSYKYQVVLNLILEQSICNQGYNFFHVVAMIQKEAKNKCGLGVKQCKKDQVIFRCLGKTLLQVEQFFMEPPGYKPCDIEP